MTYSEKLKDPRWQKKRLEILERDGWKCTVCGADKHQLHVHHKKYSGDPWQSLKKDLITVCCYCHELISTDNNFKSAVNNDSVKSGISTADIDGYSLYIIVYSKTVLLREVISIDGILKKHEINMQSALIDNIKDIVNKVKRREVSDGKRTSVF